MTRKDRKYEMEYEMGDVASLDDKTFNTVLNATQLKTGKVKEEETMSNDFKAKALTLLRSRPDVGATYEEVEDWARKVTSAGAAYVQAGGNWREWLSAVGFDVAC